MNLPFRIEPEAEEELLRAAQWYEERRPGLGAEFITAIDTTLDLIARWPDAGAPVRQLPKDLPVRRILVRRFPYHVVYLKTSDAIRLLAIAHDHSQAEILAVPN